MASVFTRIVTGELPAAKVYEDGLTLAFLDIRPAARGHTLVIPKDEYANLYDMPPELLSAVAITTQKVAQAIKDTLNPDGINILQNNGAEAGQTVFHYHIHILPRWRGDQPIIEWTQSEPEPAALETLAKEIRTKIEDDMVGPGD